MITKTDITEYLTLLGQTAGQYNMQWGSMNYQLGEQLRIWKLMGGLKEYSLTWRHQGTAVVIEYTPADDPNSGAQSVKYMLYWSFDNLREGLVKEEVDPVVSDYDRAMMGI